MNWAVLVGGTGSNLNALCEAGCPVRLVVSHRDRVGALDIARRHGVEHAVLLPRTYSSRTDYDAALSDVLAQYGIERIAMAGFLRWLTPAFTARWPGRILNLHPSLLPAYPGLNAIERAFADRVLWSGVTVHFVDEGHDSGPIVAQMPVPRLAHDTVEAFQTRVHEAEHALYPRVVQAVDGGDVFLSDGLVVYREENLAWMHGR